METDLQSQEDFLLPNLLLGVAPQASYVKQRRNATVHSAIASCSPGGVTTAKWTLSSATEWMDASSVVVSFIVQNNDAAKVLKPGTVGAHCLFERCTLRAGGQVIEDMDHYGRMCEAFERCVPAEKRVVYGALGFGQTMAMTAAAATQAAANMTIAEAGAERLVTPQIFSGGLGHVPKDIPANVGGAGSKRVFMRLPLSGLMQSKKWIPLWAIAGGIEVLLTLAPAADAMVSGAPIAGAGGPFTNSMDYQLRDLRIEADFVQIDPALDEQYRQNLEEGGSLKLHLKTWDLSQQFLGQANAGNADITVQKSLSRLATIFANFAPELEDADKQAGALYCNTFLMYPQAEETLESHVTIGARRFPDYPNKGTTEHYWRLLNALGVALSLPHSINVDYESYKTNSFLVGADVEKAPMVMSSGENTTGGQELALHIKNFTDGAGSVPRRAFIALHHEIIVDIQIGGLSVKK